MKNVKSTVSNVDSALVLSGILLFILSGCSGNGGSSGTTPPMDGASTPVPKLSWEVCESSSMLECSSLIVPIDYRLPDGEKITIALNRLPATGAQTLGSLILNPGGPGGSGIDFLHHISEASMLPTLLRNSYDIIGFDPRGVGKSSPVDCDEYGVDDSSVYPQNAEDIALLLASRSTAASLCAEKYGSYLSQLGSRNVVRDMDSMRAALGDEHLNFLGYSYGTRLAALYLQEYPTLSGRMVLDASMLPASDLFGLSEGTLVAMQANLSRMLSFCIHSNPNCNPSELESRLTTRMNALLESDDPAADQEFELLGELITIGIQEPDIGELAVDPISEYLIAEDPSILSDFVALMESLEGSEESDDSDGVTAQFAVMCADDATRPDYESLTTLLDSFNATSDLFAELMLGQASMCAGWPAAIEPLSPIAVGTAPVSVVIGGATDALTPLGWGKQMAQSIGAVFVESGHLGHTVLFLGASSCADDIATRFLVEGILPENAVCPLEEN